MFYFFLSFVFLTSRLSLGLRAKRADKPKVPIGSAAALDSLRTTLPPGELPAYVIQVVLELGIDLLFDLLVEPIISLGIAVTEVVALA